MSAPGTPEKKETSQRRSEQEASRQFEIAEYLLGTMVQGVIATVDGLVVALSAKLAGLLGYQSDELIGKPAATIIDCDWIDGPNEQSHWELPCDALTRAGCRIPVHVRTSRIEPHDSAFVAIVASAEQIPSAPPEPNESIVRLQKLQNLGTLSRGIAHDFNNLLLGILGNADLALLESNVSSPSMGYLIDIKTTAERATALSHQLFEFSDDDPPSLQPVCLNDLITSMQQLIDVATGQRGLLRLDLAPVLPKVMAVPSQLQQVILSLSTNAAEAMDLSRGSIRLTTKMVEPGHEALAAMHLPLASSYVLFEIEDNGEGIASDAAPHLFEPFFSTKGAGRGLGLFASRSIVQYHRGDLAVKRAQTKGTVVSIALPSVASSRAPAMHPSRVAPSWKGSGTVLVVDDEHFIRTIVRQMLENIGFKVETAYDGQEAVNMVRRDPKAIRLVLLDLTMPHMDGESAFREIRNITRDVKVVVMSGYRARDIAARFETTPPDGFIQKPFDTQDIMETIKRVLEP
ncbi:MAG: response regulator [Myxococcota bacterium]|jgi:signal transduction histidine kinase|nr:response regulator [Myxococcota bacterium]